MIAIPLFAYAAVVVIAFLVIVALLAIVYKTGKTGDRPASGTQPRVPVDDDEDAQPIPRRGGRKTRGALRPRGRLNRRPIRAEEESSSDDEQADVLILKEIEKEEKVAASPKGGKKVGVKKQRKLEAKEAKKQEREAFLERKARQKQEEEVALEESKKRKAKEEEDRKKQELEEKQWKEEREKKAKEELDKWRDFIEVESSGSLQTELEEKRKRLEKFADYIKGEKVVMLEDLAVEFGLRTQEVISEIESLEAQGKLTGVIDERGKFIYITPEEMAAVARFIKLRGRVSIDEIAAESNKLVDVNPKKSPLRDDATDS